MTLWGLPLSYGTAHATLALGYGPRAIHALFVDKDIRYLYIETAKTATRVINANRLCLPEHRWFRVYCNNCWNDDNNNNNTAVANNNCRIGFRYNDDDEQEKQLLVTLLGANTAVLLYCRWMQTKIHWNPFYRSRGSCLYHSTASRSVHTDRRDKTKRLIDFVIADQSNGARNLCRCQGASLAPLATAAAAGVAVLAVAGSESPHCRKRRLLERQQQWREQRDCCSLCLMDRSNRPTCRPVEARFKGQNRWAEAAATDTAIRTRCQLIGAIIQISIGVGRMPRPWADCRFGVLVVVFLPHCLSQSVFFRHSQRRQ